MVDHNHINSLHIILTVYTQGVHNQKARTVERQLYWVMCSAHCPTSEELPKLLVLLTICSVSQNKMTGLLGKLKISPKTSTSHCLTLCFSHLYLHLMLLW